jgi:hypothetical protein
MTLFSRTEEVACFGKDHKTCCDSVGFVDETASPCYAPVASSETKALVGISVIFAFIASAYPD